MDASTDTAPTVEVIGTDETCLTFVLRNEDHTLGNALRYVLMKNPDVKFCGYSIPHPSENVMNIRVESNGKSAADLFRKAVQDLKQMMEHLHESFMLELETFDAMQSEE